MKHNPIAFIYFYFLFFILFFSFIFISWRLITLQYCSGFCHTLTYLSVSGLRCIMQHCCGADSLVVVRGLSSAAHRLSSLTRGQIHVPSIEVDSFF